MLRITVEVDAPAGAAQSVYKRALLNLFGALYLLAGHIGETEASDSSIIKTYRGNAAERN